MNPGAAAIHKRRADLHRHRQRLICHIVIGTPRVVLPTGSAAGTRWWRGFKPLPNSTRSQPAPGTRHPFTPTAEAIRDMTPCMVMPVRYSGTVAVAPVKDKTDFVTHFQGARTPMIDSVAENVRRKKVLFGSYGDEEQHIVAHLQDMVREETRAFEPPRVEKADQQGPLLPRARISRIQEKAVSCEEV